MVAVNPVVRFAMNTEKSTTRDAVVMDGLMQMIRDSGKKRNMVKVGNFYGTCLVGTCTVFACIISLSFSKSNGINKRIFTSDTQYIDKTFYTNFPSIMESVD